MRKYKNNASKLKSGRWIFVLLSVVIFLASNVTSAETYKSVQIEKVPHVKQKPDFCGEACVEMWMKNIGKKADQDWVYDQSMLDPLQGRGVYTAELKTALANIGFNPGTVWYNVDASTSEKLSAGMNVLFSDMHKDLLAGIPSIVCTRFDESEGASEHFRLVLGYNEKEDTVIYHDPALDDAAYLTMKRDVFLRIWPLKYNPAVWTVIRLRLEGEASTLKDSEPSKSPTPADFAQYMMRNRKNIPQNFNIVVAPPFLVVGDESQRILNQRTNGTIKWASENLKKLYFSKELDKIITVWLFKDAESYNKYNKELFQTVPTTPFGYYSPDREALVMNIATGGGTLVHEIVHPYVHVNFPDCPSWFNEGLGSLYEQSADRGGMIVGLTNWRLAGLQEAIRKNELPLFKELLTNNNFYNKDPGTNYAQARYLCYYLQEKGLLVKYYKEFFKNQKTDPTGYVTLCEILGKPEMKKFQKDWEEWVLKLVF